MRGYSVPVCGYNCYSQVQMKNNFFYSLRHFHMDTASGNFDYLLTSKVVNVLYRTAVVLTAMHILLWKRLTVYMRVEYGRQCHVVYPDVTSD